MEEIVKKINALDLSFEQSDYFEIEFCADRCLVVESNKRRGRLISRGSKGDASRFLDDEKKCFESCFGKLANHAILLNKAVKRSVFNAYMNENMNRGNQ